MIFAVDRSGIVGHDGRTHQGVFDLSYLIPMPGMTVISPMDGEELVSALDYAYECETGPVAIRYPRGTAYRYSPDEDEFLSTDRAEFLRGKAEVLSEGREAVIFAVGDMVKTALAVRDELEAEMVRVTVVNMRFVKPFDEEIVRELAGKHTVVATLEDNVLTGGFGESVGAFLQREGIQVKGFLNLALPDEFIPHGSAEELYGVYGLDAEHVAEKIRETYHEVR